MAPLRSREFAALLRGLSAREFASFVAELWRRRGWAARVEDDRVILTAADGTTRRLLLAHDPGWSPRISRSLRAVTGRPAVADRSVPDAVDAVVTSAPDARASPGLRDESVDVVGAEELRRIALYAIDRDACEALFESYFGRSPAASTAARDEAVSVTTLALVALLGVVLVGVAAGGLLAPDTLDDGRAPTGGDAGGTPTAEPTATAESAADDGTATVAPADYPPGLNADGVVDAELLSRVHAFVLAGTPRRWTITYREVDDEGVRGYRRERVTVENATVYRSTVERDGTVTSPTFLVSDVSTYANGSVRYDRRETADGVTYRRHDLGTGADDVPPFEPNPRLLVAWYLSVQESEIAATEVRNGTRFYRVHGTGDDWPRTTNVTTTATVDEYGIVRDLRRVHEPPDRDVRIVVTYRLRAVGNATVTPPPWLSAARRAT